MTAQQPPVPLDYASSDSDGLPTWVDQAEALIDSGAPPRAIRKYFRRAVHAVKYYARSMSRRYDVNLVSGQCVQCGKPDNPYVTQIVWNVQMPARFGELQLTDTAPNQNFSTYHSICADCYTDWYRRLRSFWPLRMMYWWLFRFVWLTSTGIIFTALIGWFGTLNWVRLWSVILAPAVLGLVLGWPIQCICRRQWPKAMRTLMPRKVKFVEVSEIIDRNSTKPV